jgi:hypothetical protein
MNTILDLQFLCRLLLMHFADILQTCPTQFTLGDSYIGMGNIEIMNSPFTSNYGCGA